MRKIDRTGQRNGRLTVVKYSHNKFYGTRTRIVWECKCDCGNTTFVVSDSLRLTKSCGCLHKESTGMINYKHGEAKNTKEYNTWAKLIARCYCKTDHKYQIYGGRGISVCDRWRGDYLLFLEDMGRCPDDKTSIDRIDTNGNYEPSNCRWCDAKEQANNVRTNVILTHNGVSKTLKQWAEYLNLNYKSFHAQIKYKGKTLKDFING